MFTPYNIQERIEGGDWQTAEELQERQRLISVYGGGIELVNPDSPISAGEFAEAAMAVFEEHHWDGLVGEIDAAMSQAAYEQPDTRLLLLAIQYGDRFDELPRACTAIPHGQARLAEDGVAWLAPGVPFHMVCVLDKVDRYGASDGGLFGGLRGLLGLRAEYDVPDDIKRANKEVTELFADELALSLEEHYRSRGFRCDRLDDTSAISLFEVSTIGGAGDRVSWPYAIPLRIEWD